jgi:transcriptional regulator of acetoin/glycerol metabolism
MGKLSKLEYIAAARSTTVEALVPSLIDAHGSVKGAADELGVSRGTLYYWLSNNGYTVTPGRTVEVMKVDD